MSSNWPKSGPSNVDAFLMSGIPYVTSSVTTAIPGRDTEDSTSGGVTKDISPVKVSFPNVTKWVTVRNIGKNTLRIGFSEAGILSRDDFFGFPNPSDNTTADGEQKKTGNLNCYFLRSSGSDSTSGGSFHPAVHRVAPETSLTDSITFNVRCTDMFFVSDISRANPAAGHATGFSIIAGLTTIPRDQFPILTGSITGSATSLYPDGVLTAFEGIG